LNPAEGQKEDERKLNWKYKDLKYRIPQRRRGAEKKKDFLDRITGFTGK
jgi:hypothetical protein